MIGASGPVSLRDTWFGARLPEEAVTRLEPHIRRATYEAGAEILREGDPTSALGIVASGRVALRLRVPERGPTTILTVEPGNIIGWSAVVPPHRATSTVVALVPTELLLLDGEALRTQLDARPGPRRGRLSLAARGAGASPARHAHATPRPVLPARRRTVVIATPAPAFLPRAGARPAPRPAPRRRSPGHRPDRPPGRHRVRRDRLRPPTCPSGSDGDPGTGHLPAGADRRGPPVRLRGRPDVVEARDVPAARPADDRSPGRRPGDVRGRRARTAAPSRSSVFAAARSPRCVTQDAGLRRRSGRRPRLRRATRRRTGHRRRVRGPREHLLLHVDGDRPRGHGRVRPGPDRARRRVRRPVRLAGR